MSRRFLALSCSVILAAPVALVVTPTASGSGATLSQAQNTTLMAKKKGKKKGKTTATVNAEWTVTESGEVQGGTETQEITISVTDGKVKFADDNATRATGQADVKITYRGHFYTENRSWAIGCETEERTTTATYVDRTWIDVVATDSWTKDGKSEKIANGWAVSVDRPVEELMRSMVTTGFYLEWESNLQAECNTVPISDPLGWWAPSFVTSYAVVGKLNGGGKGVMLIRPFTNRDQTATATGKIEFSESVEKRGTKSGGAR